MRRQRKTINRTPILALLLSLILSTSSLGLLAPGQRLSAAKATPQATQNGSLRNVEPIRFETIVDFSSHDDAYVIEQSFDSPIGEFELLTGDFARVLPFQGDLPDLGNDEDYYYFRAKFTNEQHIPLDVSMLFAYLFIEDPTADPDVRTPLFEATLYAIEDDRLASERHLVHADETLDGLFILTLPQNYTPRDPLRLRVFFANGRTRTVCRLGSVCEGLTDEVFEVSRKD